MRSPIAPLLLILGTSILSTPGFAQHAPGFPTLQQGTPINLQLDETLNSATARIGQRVAFEVSNDVVLDGRVVIPAGSAALGTIAQVKHRGWAGRIVRSNSKLDVNIDTVRLPSGQIVPLTIQPSDNSSAAGDNNLTSQDSAIATSMVPSPATSHMLAAHRNDVLIPEGTMLRAFVRQDTIVVQTTASVSN